MNKGARRGDLVFDSPMPARNFQTAAAILILTHIRHGRACPGHDESEVGDDAKMRIAEPTVRELTAARRSLRGARSGAPYSKGAFVV